MTSLRAEVPCLGQLGHMHALGGGFVADSAQVDLTVTVGVNAQVCDYVFIKGSNIFVKGKSIVSDHAHVTTFGTGKVVINGNSLITGNAQVIAKDGKIIVGDNAKLFSAPLLSVESDGSINVVESAEVSGDAQLMAKISSQISVGFEAVVTEQAQLSARRLGSIQVLNKAVVAGSARLELPEDSATVPASTTYVSLIYITQASRIIDLSKVVSRSGGKVYLEGNTTIRESAQVLARGLDAYLVITGKSDLSNHYNLSVTNDQRLVDIVRP